MTFTQSFFLYIYAFISTLLLHSYKAGLYFYINYPTLASALGNLIVIYVAYKLFRTILRFIYSSVVAFVRLVFIFTLLVVGIWCYLRGVQRFASDLGFLWSVFKSQVLDVKYDTEEFIHELDNDQYSYAYSAHQRGSGNAIGNKHIYQQTGGELPLEFNIWDLSRSLRVRDLQQLVELFGLNLIQAYRIGAGSLYSWASSENWLRQQYDGLVNEFNQEYQNL